MLVVLLFALGGCEGALSPSPPSDAAVSDLVMPDLAPPMIDWVRVDGGTFKFGCATGSYPGMVTGEWDETALTVDFMRNDVTVGEYRTCVLANACSAPRTETVAPTCNWNRIDVPEEKRSGFENHPINCISWSQANDFCSWIGGRLATSIEWEHAARPDGRTYPWGEEDAACGTTNARAWCGQIESAGTAPVGSFPLGASRDGLLDLGGNIWTWIADEYGMGREIRGGRWQRPSDGLKSCFRASAQAPDFREAGIGLRCVREVQ
jgi:formylglycine-generating enzyme required for sulfatase activity